MAVPDIDTWRSAALLIKAHGDGAWDHAAERYFALREARDVQGMLVWRRIAQAIAELTDREPGAILN